MLPSEYLTDFKPKTLLAIGHDKVGFLSLLKAPIFA